jgi:ribose transport system substrate-binding protein
LKKRQLIPIAATAAVVALMLAACSSGASSTTGTKYKIDGVFENTSDPFWATSLCGAKKEAKTLGVDFTISSIPTQDESKLATTLATATLNKPDGIVFNPIDTTSWNSTVGGYMKKGVPVVSQSNAIPTLFGYAQSQQSGGPLAGPIKKVLSGQSGQAVLALGLALGSATWEQQRVGPMKDAVTSANPNITWLADNVDGFDINKGTAQLATLITSHPDLKVIIATAGPEGQAAAAAVQQTHSEGKVDVFAFDAVPAEVEGIKNGSITLLAAQQAANLGADQVKLLVKYLKAKGTGSKKAIDPDWKNYSYNLPVTVIDKANVNEPNIVGSEYSATCSG